MTRADLELAADHSERWALMQYQVNRERSFPVIELKGALALDDERQDFREWALHTVATELTPLILDLSRSKRPWNTLLSEIVFVFAMAKKQNRTLVLAAPNRTFGRYLHTTGIQRAIPIFRTVDDAIAFLEGRPHTKWVHAEEAFDPSRLGCIGGCLLIVILLVLGIVWMVRR